MAEDRGRLTTGSTRWVAITATMTALAIVGNYSVVFIPNVEFGTIVLFLTAYIFGLQMAFWSTLITSIVFGTLNPWGGFIPSIWLSQVIGWIYVVIAGSIVGQPRKSVYKELFSPIEIGCIGLVVTAIFDFVTNIGYSLTFSVPFLIALVAGLPFMIVHVVSNAILFASVVPRLHRVISEQFNLALAEVENKSLTLEGEE
ncbi:MAG: ECF transporter S component [Candidatus Thorarchaeota archaeon]